MSEQKEPGRENDMLDVFIRALEGADRVVVETRNAVGEKVAHYMHAPEILASWNTRADLAPKVKPLVWEDYPLNGEPVWSMAITASGTYFIVDDVDDFSGLYLEYVSHYDAKWWGHVRPSSNMLADHYHGDDMAPLKAAAQSDYEARILAALDWMPMPAAPEAD